MYKLWWSGFKSQNIHGRIGVWKRFFIKLFFKYFFVVTKLNINLFKNHLKTNLNLGRKMSITFWFFAFASFSKNLDSFFIGSLPVWILWFAVRLRYIAMLLISINHGGQQKPNTFGKNILHLGLAGAFLIFGLKEILWVLREFFWTIGGFWELFFGLLLVFLKNV